MIAEEKSGHRERMRKRFLKREKGSFTDEALLELLLTYAIPQKDVQPLAKQLIDKFGNLENVLSADFKTLCSFDGIKAHTAFLLKLMGWIRLHYSSKATHEENLIQQATLQHTLFEPLKPEIEKTEKTKERQAKPIKKPIPRRGTALFGKAILKEAIELLPKLPDTESLSDVREFLRRNIHFSAVETRRRYADYIILRMFPKGYADKALSLFARKYVNHQELKDVCFYRFCNVEHLMFDVIETLFIPAMGAGHIKRERLREYLKQRFPASKMIADSAKAIVDALTAGGILKADRTTIYFSYRDILLPSFAFILHSEFQEPGMYDIEKLESNRAIRSMLWNPTRILPALYELRNQGLISKISEIDKVRQFTTRWTLDEVVTKLLDEKGRQ